MDQEVNQDAVTKLPRWRKWIPVVVLSLALAIIIIDTTLLNVALSKVIADLHTDLQSIQWVITAYSLTLAALMITGGRLGDLYGRKKMFITGAALFAVGSFIASISNNISTMIAGESIIEGVGAALMMPATSSLLVSTYRGRDRAIAMGVWGGIAAASSAVGPILGGYLTTNFSWRWGFRINVFVAALLIIMSVFVNDSRDREEKSSLDFLGVVLSSLGLLGIVFGAIESTTYGWWKAKQTFVFFGHSLALNGYSIVPCSIVVGVVLLILFGLWQARITKKGHTPLVSLRLFQNKQYTSSVAVTTMMAIGQAGFIFSIPVFFEAVRGLDAYHTGLAFLPMSVTALFFAPISAIIGRKWSVKRMIQIGYLCTVIAMILIHRTLGVNAVQSDFILGMIFYGVGLGASMSLLANMTLSAVSVEEAGEASGVNNTFRQLGSTLGSAIIGAALLAAISTNMTNNINDSKVIPSAAKAQITQAVSAQSFSVEFGDAAKIPGKISPAISEEITRISHQATTDSNKLSILYTLAFSIAGLFLTFFLPNKRDLEQNTSIASKH